MRLAVKSIRLLSDGFFTINKGLLVYMKTKYYGQKYRGVLRSLLIECDDHWVLVDTGAGKAPAKQMQAHEVDHKTTLERSLAENGLSPADISIVVNTHLHFDHCGNNALFKEAEFFVREPEIRYAYEPDKFQQFGYVRESFAPVEYRTYAGERKICGGVTAIPTPGHTPGHQSVVVEMEGKKYVFCGDIAPIRENIEDRAIVGILHSPVQALESLDRLIALKGTYIYSHDAEQAGI